jgi:hypothetical protein
MPVKIESQLAQIAMLLRELKSELQVVSADIVVLKEHVLEEKKPARKYAVITLPFTYEFGEPAITLTEEDWIRVKSGETVQILGKGQMIEGDFFYWDRWEFSGGMGGVVKLDMKFEENGEFEAELEEKLTAELIEEFDVVK